MGLVFITGVSGTGKSAVRHALLARGWDAYDTDEGGMTRWCDRTSGLPVEGPERGSSPDWIERHDWNISRPRVEELAEHAADRTVFLCGSPTNDQEVWDLFSEVICLVIDDETLRTRLARRTSNDFGKAPHELEAVLRWNKHNEAQYRDLGATIIDASKPLEGVVEEILEVVT